MKSPSSPVTQSGRTFSIDELKMTQKIVGLYPNLDRRELADTVSELLNWHTVSGTTKSTACLKLLEKLELSGYVQLPEKRMDKVRYRSKQKINLVFTAQTARPAKAIQCTLRNLSPISLSLVTDKSARSRWNEYVDRYHYLGYKRPIGFACRYFIHAENNALLGCILIAGCAKKIKLRDQWIGWDSELRQKNSSWVINNTRFLIFPWVNVPHLASHVLSLLTRRVRHDYLAQWGFMPLLMETFVDPAHYQGTCYKAANWRYLGETTGIGLSKPGKHYSTSPKMIFVYPLAKKACRHLSRAPLKSEYSDNDL